MTTPTALTLLQDAADLLRKAPTGYQAVDYAWENALGQLIDLIERHGRVVAVEDGSPRAVYRATGTGLDETGEFASIALLARQHAITTGHPVTIEAVE